MAKKPKSKSEARRLAIQKKPKKKVVKQTAIDLETGKQTEVDADATGMTAEELEAGDDDGNENLKESQANIVARIANVQLKDFRRTATLNVLSHKMIIRMGELKSENKEFHMKMTIPTEIEEGEVKESEDIEFTTRLGDVKMGNGKGTCKIDLSVEAVVALNRLINNWAMKDAPVEFFIDGIQQSLF